MGQSKSNSTAHFRQTEKAADKFYEQAAGEIIDTKIVGRTVEEHFIALTATRIQSKRSRLPLSRQRTFCPTNKKI
jgi:hypothetical protein